jgi:hypothetical protein
MLWGDGFEVETLINVRIAKAGLKIAEVPSFEADRIHGDSNLNAISDGIRVLKTIATERRTALAVDRPRTIRLSAVQPAVAPPAVHLQELVGVQTPHDIDRDTNFEAVS